MASQIAFQDNVVIKIKTERDVPSSYCSENYGSPPNLDSPQQNGRVASLDHFHHARQQMIFQDSEQGREKMLTTTFKQLKPFRVIMPSDIKKVTRIDCKHSLAFR